MSEATGEETEFDCRFCGFGGSESVLDLGTSPPCNDLLSEAALKNPETFYPLHVRRCEECHLVQLPNVVPPEELFSDYRYFSSYSDTWLDHSRRFVEAITKRRNLDKHSKVVELASNDGYLLQYFVERGIPCLGIEPAEKVAEAARAKGVRTESAFFGSTLARELEKREGTADVIIANNVLAHVPELNDFVEGMRILLSNNGTVTVEVPHLLRLLEGNQFDTIYHEHYSYFSLGVLEKLFARHGIPIYDLDELPTHGGSLRLYAAHEDEGRPVSKSVLDVRKQEQRAQLTSNAPYRRFAERVASTKLELLEFLIGVRKSGGLVAGYGAPGKGNTLLNYCGIGPDLVTFTVDRNPHKQGHYLPGSRIPVFSPDRIGEVRPDVVLILPWNIKDEIVRQMDDVYSWGGKFVTAIPELEVLG